MYGRSKTQPQNRTLYYNIFFPHRKEFAKNILVYNVNFF